MASLARLRSDAFVEIAGVVGGCVMGRSGIRARKGKIMERYYTRMESPIGALTLVSDGAALIGLYMNEHKHGPAPEGWAEKESATPLPEVKRQLAEYFAGQRAAFDLPLAAQGTPFQQRVWRELCHIKYGETISYGELARRLGEPNASRAVGMANGRNPVSIVVPCHRVIGANGKLTGYGGGMERKAFLLDLEKRGESAEGVNLFALTEKAGL